MTKRQSKSGQKNAFAPRDLVPILAHRLFPAFAALWFAALFGLGSLAISSSVLGQVAVMTGLPAIIPAAAPPLGFTAHALFALLLAIAGGAAGLAIGLAVQRSLPEQKPAPVYAPLRRSAAPTPPAAATDAPKVRARDAHPDAPPRRPLELTDALAAEPIPPFNAALAEAAEAEALDLAAFDAAPVVPDAPDSAEPEIAIVDAPEAAPEIVPEAAPETAMPAAQEPAPLQDAATCALRAAGLTPGDAPARKLLADQPLGELGMLQLIERLALALDTRRTQDRAAPEEHELADPAPAGPPLGALTERYASLLAVAPAPAPQADAVLRFPSDPARHGLAAIPAPRMGPGVKAPVPLPRAPFASADEADTALRSALATLKRMAAQG